MSNNTEFKWTDETVAEFAEWYRKEQGRCQPENWGKDLVEQFKESKQPKPEWEILSYLSNTTPSYVIDISHLNWNFAVIRNYPIHSVKRLSDGEVFTIGDKVWPNLTVKSFYSPTQDEARYGECDLAVSFEEPNANYCLKDLKHRNQVFTTEDGVGISIGDKYWYVTKDFILFSDECDSHTGGKFVANTKVGDVFFSTKEAAKEYIIENKPLLSLKEIREVGHAEKHNHYYKKLVALAESKLK